MFLTFGRTRRVSWEEFRVYHAFASQSIQPDLIPIMIPESNEVTQLLVAWGDGDQSAFDKLMPLVYDELHTLARRYMARERPEHTLQASVLVNAAYVRLIDQRNMRWQNRAQFFGIAATLMRRILVSYARSRHYSKRGGNARRISLDEALIVS